jgi:ribosome-binding factor A
MARKRKSNDSLSQYRGTIDADDGLDPRDFFRKETSTAGRGRKSHQLCAQVADTLRQIFEGECGDAVLQGLVVLDVSPAPDASQLLVQVGPLWPEAPLDPTAVAAALAGAAGWLRTEVASAITRNRTPRLVFRYVPDAPIRTGDDCRSAESEVQP